MIQKAIGCFFIFILVPFGTGLLYSRWLGNGKSRAGILYLAGFLTQLALFQVVAVPVMIKEVYGMQLLVGLMTALLAFFSAAGILTACIRWKNERAAGFAFGGRAKKISWEYRIFWLIALAAIGFQMYMSYAYASFDGDDAYYVVQSVIADQTGVLNRIRPYTGLSTDLDIRHALATLPLWEAYIARLTGIHATIVAHTLLPLVLIPLTYLVYYEIGRQLLGDGNVKLPVFLALVSILQIWGNTSIYTNATFFLMRTWQGKSILANLVLLVQIWLLLEILDEKRPASAKGFWALLVINNVVSAMMTSMGAFLAAVFVGIVGLVAAIRQKKLSILVKLCICCIPNVFYLLMLVVMG